MSLSMFCIVLFCTMGVVEVLTYLNYKNSKGKLMGLYHIHAVTTFAWLSLLILNIMIGFQDLGLHIVWTVLFVPTVFVSLVSAMGITEASSKGMDTTSGGT